VPTRTNLILPPLQSFVNC